MSIKVITTVAALSIAALPAFAQTEAEVAVVVPGAEGAVVAGTGTAVTTTGFVPLAGAALGAAGPLAIGLGAIIAIGAIAGGGGSSSTTSTTSD